MRHSSVVAGVVDRSWFIKVQRHPSGAALSPVGIYAFRVGALPLSLSIEVKEDEGTDKGKGQNTS